ncbi:unnamed protein product [Mycena citricolor]|uniref:Uncharacterized protein n=1 Tax=Mycena citricolor TaxID=2018698 RepID=A0AAD2HXM4_9AGAR|nr:unnamed protein product [Mycena citricolor]
MGAILCCWWERSGGERVFRERAGVTGPETAPPVQPLQVQAQNQPRLKLKPSPRRSSKFKKLNPPSSAQPQAQAEPHPQPQRQMSAPKLEPEPAEDPIPYLPDPYASFPAQDQVQAQARPVSYAAAQPQPASELAHALGKYQATA